MKFKNIKIPSYLKNRYAVTILFFVVWLTFFDKNNFISQYSYHQEINKLQKDKDYYLSEITENKKELIELTTNSVLIEKFAREKYLMKKDDEEIFVIVPANTKKNENFTE